MSSDIMSVLQLDKEPMSGRLIVVKEINGCDSAFLTSCILGHCIKNKQPTIIVTMHNTESHFQNVGIKMNYNLQRHIDSGHINFYNVGAEFVNRVLDNKEANLDTVCLEIKNRMQIVKDKFHSVNVIIDGLTHLFDLQFSLSDVNKFCNDVIKLCRVENSLLIINTNVATDDDVTHVISNLLSHKAQTVVSVESLSSGWSADVSGHLSLSFPGKKFETEHMFNLDLKPSRYLFKLFDRGVKLFAPGTV